MTEKEVQIFNEMLQTDQNERIDESNTVEKKLKAQDEYEAVKLY